MKNKKTISSTRIPSRLMMALCVASCTMPAAAENTSAGWIGGEILRMRAYPRLHRAHQAIIKQDYPKAAAALREYLALRPGDLDARLLYLDVLYRLKDKEALSVQTARVLARYPSNSKAIVYRQRLASESATATVEAAPEPPVTVAEIDVKASKAMVRKPAPRHRFEVRQANPAVARSVNKLAQVPAGVADEPGEARQPDADRDALSLAYAALDEVRMNEAVVLFRQALQREPRASTHIALARTYVMLGEHENAIDHYAQVAGDDSLRATADHEQGNVLALQGKLALAYGYWRQAERSDRSAGLQMKLAYVEARDGQIEHARARLEAIDIDAQPVDVQTDIHYRLAELYERTGDVAQASRHLMLALPVSPSAAGYYRLALFAMQQQDWPKARQWLESAAGIDPSNALILKQLGYICKTLADDQCTINSFKSALRISPDQAKIHGELGYAYTRLGQNAQALDAFREAIDGYNAGFLTRSYLQPPEETDSGPMDGALTDGDAYAIRQQVREMNRGLQFNAYQSYRPGSGVTSTGTSPGFLTGGAIPSQGGVELLYQPADIGYRDGRTLRFFARTLWSTQPKSLKIDQDSLQGGVGVEYKPLKALNAYLSVERLIKIGDQSQDNTLLRASWGYSDGYEMKPGVSDWNYTVAYADVGYLLEKSRARSAYLEVRQGRSFNSQDRWTITPHVTFAGRAQDPDPQRVSYAELGAGVSWKVLFNETVYEAPRSSLELTLQYRKPLDQDRAAGWVLVGALRY